MEVALVNPGRDPSLAISEPLNLGFIASYLEKHGARVSIIDELAGDDVQEKLKIVKPDVVGITATTVLANDAYRIADFCKKIGIRKVVIGGVHATIMTNEALKHADIVVQGEGETAMLAIINNEVMEGVVKLAHIRNLDEIPPPARHLMNVDFYAYTKDRLPGTHLYFVPRNTRTASILTTRGCIYNCIFCYNSWRDIPIRSYSPERVISEIHELVDRYKIKALFFMDDDIFCLKRRLRKICELMINEKLNLIWGCQACVDNVDYETLRLMKEAGCQQISFGFESGSERILKLLKNRDVTIEQNKRAIALSKKAGLKILGTFMIGSPTETPEDIKKTIDFIRTTDIDWFGIFVTTPYPGTELWKWCQKQGFIPDKLDWSMFTTGDVPIPACENMDADMIRKEYHHVREKVYEICAIRELSIQNVLTKFVSPRIIYRSFFQPKEALEKMFSYLYQLMRRLR